MPLRVRRLIFSLGYMGYLLDLSNDHYARAALNSLFELAAQGERSWASTIQPK